MRSPLEPRAALLAAAAFASAAEAAANLPVPLALREKGVDPESSSDPAASSSTSSSSAAAAAAAAGSSSSAASAAASASASSASQLQPADSTRIIGGIEATSLRYSYAASLQFAGEHFCGGCLLGPDVVLTAGHCAGGSLSSSGSSVTYDVVIGRHDLTETWTGQKIRKRLEVRHPEYDEDTVDNDFNLVFLRKSVTLADVAYVRPNFDPSSPYPDAPLSVVGWGDLDVREHVSKMSEVLLEAEVYGMTNEKCERSEGPVETSWGTITTDLRGGITENMVCALAEEKDACQGDSGGPLIRRGDATNGADDVVVGVVSWGLGCADANFPGVYSRVSAQYGWIRSTVCEHSSDPPSWFDCGSSAVDLASPPSSPVAAPSWYPVFSAMFGSPTPPPAPSPLPEGYRMLRVAVELDDEPSQTGWRLTTSSSDDADAEEFIYEVSVGSYDSEDAWKVLEYDVPAESGSFYRLTILDANGDGFQGSVAVVDVTNESSKSSSSSSSDVLAREPGFSAKSGTAVSHGFYVGPPSPPAYLTLRFRFDRFAHEVAYEVKSEDDGTILALSWFRSFVAGDDSASAIVPIYGPERGDREYKLSVWDEGGDGICCSWGNGKYELYLGSAEDGNLLTESDGRYGSGDAFQFTVPAASLLPDPPTVEPTRVPTKRPTKQPTLRPTKKPTRQPTEPPTARPSRAPTASPSTSPTTDPTREPVLLALPSDPIAASTTSPLSSDSESSSDLPLGEIFFDFGKGASTASPLANSSAESDLGGGDVEDSEDVDDVEIAEDGEGVVVASASDADITSAASDGKCRRGSSCRLALHVTVSVLSWLLLT